MFTWHDLGTAAYGATVALGMAHGFGSLFFNRAQRLIVPARLNASLSFMIVIAATDAYMGFHDLFQDYPRLLGVACPIYFLWAPVFFLHVKSLLYANDFYKLKTFVHFIPFILVILLMIPFYLMPNSEKLNYIQMHYDAEISYLYWIKILFVFFYMFGVYRYFLKKKSVLKEFFSDLEGLHFVYLKELIIFQIIIGIPLLVVSLAVLFSGAMTYKILCIILMVFFALNLVGQLVILILKIDLLYSFAKCHELDEVDDLDMTEVEESIKRISKLKPEEKNLVKGKLIHCLESNKPYLKMSLKLSELAEMIGTPSYILSEVINSEFDKNYHDLINGYRIEEAKARLVDDQYDHLTILAIANDVGFNSKSVFNTAFKKHTNMTPSEYRRAKSST
jgi:AraC-like DNA-binding protein